MPRYTRPAEATHFTTAPLFSSSNTRLIYFLLSLSQDSRRRCSSSQLRELPAASQSIDHVWYASCYSYLESVMHRFVVLFAAAQEYSAT